MSEIRTQKEAVVEEIKSKIQAAKSVVLVDYKGNFRKAGVEYKVYKNRLAKIAFNELGYTCFDAALEGPTAIAFAMNDSVSAAKIAAEGGKKFNKLETKCGLVDGEFNDADALKIIASLPSREVLIAKMLGSMLAPISKLAYVLNAIAEKQEAQA